MRLRRSLSPENERFDARLHGHSIFAGALMTLGASLIFLLFGNAIGLRLANVYANTAVSDGLKAASWIYMLITMVFANSIGGYFAGQSSTVRAQSSGLIHGLTTWALANVIIFAVGTLGTTVVPVLLVGVAGNGLNWLSFFVVTLGCLASGLAAILGERSRVRGAVYHEEERKIA